MESEVQYANLPRVYTPSPTTPSAQQQLRENDENDYEKLRQHVVSSSVSGPARNPPSYSPTASTFYSSAAAAAAAAANPALGPQQYPPPPPQYPPPAEAYAGQVPYGQPLAGYPPQYIAPPPPQQQVVMVSAGQQQPHTVILHQLPSYVGHIVFACIVFWLCNLLFGLIAFILAVMASSTAVSDPSGARRLGKVSMVMSVVGIVVTVVIVIVVVAWAVSVANRLVSDALDSCTYIYHGTCYTDYEYVGTFGYCSGVKSSAGYCYHN